MKYLIVLASLFLFGCANTHNESKLSEEIWFPESNLRNDGFYYEQQEINALSAEAKCLDSSCNSVTIDGQRYIKAELLTASNSGVVAPGSWTGGLCSNDYWRMHDDGSFESGYPLDGLMYEWKGKYSFSASSYLEIGKNSRGDAEHNEANLFYVPTLDLIIFKGIKSLTGIDANGDKKFTYYDTSEYPYFRRCTG